MAGPRDVPKIATTTGRLEVSRHLRVATMIATATLHDADGNARTMTMMTTRRRAEEAGLHQ